MGILLRYGLPETELAQFIFSRRYTNTSCSQELEIGEIIQLSSWNSGAGEGDSFLCSVTGKVFRDEQGNYIRQTVGVFCRTAH